MEHSDLLDGLNQQGYCVLPGVFSEAEINAFRAATMNNLAMMGQTRDVVHAYHLAGFHRFPALAELHAQIAGNDTLNAFLSAYYGGRSYYAIGLSDITVNRSQHWHTDLLRGKYSAFLDQGVAWAEMQASCIKALVYLQDGASLAVVPGSHAAPTPLDDVQLEELANSADVVRAKVRTGDVVMMDIRVLHRGSTDADMRRPELAQNPKILFSTVFGPVKSEFAQAMQIGNAHRMADWDRRFLN